MLNLTRNAIHFNNCGKTNYKCFHLKIKIDVKYCFLARLASKKGNTVKPNQ